MADPAQPADSTHLFADHRELLSAIVYGMLASVADTEDVLQETWLAWAARDPGAIANPRAYLVRIAVNKALAQQALMRRRRETYIGPWLPEPLVAVESAASGVERAESVSLAMPTPGCAGRSPSGSWPRPSAATSTGCWRSSRPR